MRIGVAQLRRAGPYVGLAVLMIVLAVVTVGPADGLALDPRSTGPEGTAALVAALTELGSDVVVADEPDDISDGTVLVLRDPVDAAWTAAVEEALADGARVVVTDPSSPLTPAAQQRFTAPAEGPDCGLDAVAMVRSVTGRGFSGYEVPDGAVGCFRIDDLAWLVVDTRDDGTLVAAANAEFLTNAALDDADNAQLAVQLLRGGPAGQVTVVGPQVAVLAASGDQGLVDLLPDRVRAALVQLLIALLVVVVWRWRRLGPPVTEELPVELSASELVVAAGELLDQADAHGEAAELLAAALRRDMALRFGLPPAAAPHRIAAAASADVGHDPQTLVALLDPGPHGQLPADGDALVRFARRVAGVRAAAGIGFRSPSPSPSGDRRSLTGSAV